MNSPTKGPWIIDQTPDGLEIHSESEHAHIATVEYYGFPEQEFADAHLVSAAPDLLEAICEFLDGVDPECGDPDCVDCTPFRKARAAIAKAKGGAK